MEAREALARATCWGTPAYEGWHPAHGPQCAQEACMKAGTCASPPNDGELADADNALVALRKMGWELRPIEGGEAA